MGEETHTLVNILNKAHIQVNSEKNPHELWFGKPPTVKHFRVFGSKCYIKNNDDKIGNFEARADEGILLGYSSRRKGYKCYNKILQKIVECIDVGIDEASTCTKREAPQDGEDTPSKSQKDVGEGINETSEEGNDNT